MFAVLLAPVSVTPPLWFAALCLFALLLVLPELKARVLFGLTGTAFFYVLYDYSWAWGWFVFP